MTLFEKIIARQIPADVVYENNEILAFRDIQPQAPVHILLIPKKIIPRLASAEPADLALLGQMVLAAAQIARDLGVQESGYRLVINNGPDAGESVPHLHLHLLAGRPLQWPPG